MASFIYQLYNITMSLEDDPLDLIFFMSQLKLDTCAWCDKPNIGIDIDSLPKCRDHYGRL